MQVQSQAASVPQQPIDAERKALVALYHATDGDNWINNTNWLSDKPIDEWFGIKREKDGSLLVDLSDNGLKGTLPAAFFQVSTISGIYFPRNQLSGSLPAEIGECTGLRYILLSKNRLSGQLPDTWQDLDELYYLTLSENDFSGTLPPSFCEMEKLNRVDLAHNQFSGSLPENIALLSIAGYDVHLFQRQSGFQ